MKIQLLNYRKKMSFRKEIKFKLTLSDQRILKYELLSCGMKCLYPERIVHSSYYDTNDLIFYNQSNEGILPRKKIRIRNYNDDKNFYKETKITAEEGRYKFSKKIINIIDFQKMIDKDYGIIIPTLEVTYNRQYFLLNNLRITFDFLIKFKDLRSSISKEISENYSVMEIKTSDIISEDYIFKIINLRTERFSKYCNGIDAFNRLI